MQTVGPPPGTVPPSHASDADLDRVQRIHVRAERLYRYALADLERILAIRYVSERPAAADPFAALFAQMGQPTGAPPRAAPFRKSPPMPARPPVAAQPAAAMHATT